MPQTDMHHTVIAADLQDSYSFTARYDDDVVRDAIRTFIWRKAVSEQKMMWVISALMVVFSIYLLIGGETGIFAGVMLALAFAPLAFVTVLARTHHINTWGRYKRMGDKTAEMIFDAEGFSITSDLGEGRVTWRNVTEAWERPRSFILFTGPAVFNIFPKDGMPEPVQLALRARAALPPVEQP